MIALIKFIYLSFKAFSKFLRKNESYIYSLGFVSSILAYSFRGYLWEFAFFHLITLTIVLMAYSYYSVKVFNGHSFKSQVLSYFVYIVALNALADEIFYKADKYFASEYILFGIYAIHTGVRIIRNKKQKDSGYF